MKRINIQHTKEKKSDDVANELRVMNDMTDMRILFYNNFTNTISLISGIKHRLVWMNKNLVKDFPQYNALLV